jgi:membrane fusion protein, multidrug efflux system
MKSVRVWIIGLVVIVVAAVVAWRIVGTMPAKARAPSAPPPAVPVEAATVTPTTVPIYLTGLGTVQAYNTVTVSSRVDGQIVKIAFTEGQDVKKGDLLAQIDPRPYKAQLDMAVAKKAQDEAQLANTQRDLERYTTLSARDYTSKQTLDTTRAQVTQLEAQIKGDDAAIDNAKTQLDYTTITSPIDGRTGIRLIDEGNIVHAAATAGIVVITQLHPISVIFTLPEDELAHVSQSMAAGPVAVTAMSRDGTAELDTGKVALIDNQIDQTTGTIKLRANFPNPKDTLWPGEFVNARVLLRDEQNALTVPSAAVQRGANGLFTYVIKPDNTVEMRPIKVSVDNTKIAVITQGVNAGDKVVTNGQYRLEPGVHVQIRTSDAAPGTAVTAEKAQP